MDVNDIFSGISSFWERISIPILFHIIFFFLYSLIFGKLSIGSKLDAFVSGVRFARARKILKEFELWKKMPIILLFGLLIYLTLFNSLVRLIGSIRFFPFNVSYSNQDFLKEYEPEENILEIAKYGKDSAMNIFQFDRLRETMLEEYKGKYPDAHDSWIKWTERDFSSRSEIFNLTFLSAIALFVTLLIRLFSRNYDRKIRSLIFYILVSIVLFPTLFLLRYRVEQSVEEKFSNGIVFVKSSVEVDTSRKITLDSISLAKLTARLQSDLNSSNINEPQFWISRIVGRSDWLQAVLGHRKLRNIKSRNEDYLL